MSDNETENQFKNEITDAIDEVGATEDTEIVEWLTGCTDAELERIEAEQTKILARALCVKTNAEALRQHRARERGCLH